MPFIDTVLYNDLASHTKHMEFDRSLFNNRPVDDPHPEIDLTLRLGSSYYDQLQEETHGAAMQNGIVDQGNQRKCNSCGVGETPIWRRGPDGPKTLCNACGLRYARGARREAANLQLEMVVAFMRPS